MLSRTFRVLLPLALTAPVAAQIVFAPPQPNPVSHPSAGVLAGDVNVDGHLDLIALPPQPGPFEASFFTTFLGDGTGLIFKTPAHLLAGTAAGEGQVVDLVGTNGFGEPDGKPDLLVGAVPGTPNNGVGWFGGLGDGSFGGSSGISLDTSITDVIAADVDGDGDLDLAALAGGSPPFLQGSLTALLKLPGGGYSLKPAIGVPGFARFLALADWDDDGKLEAASSGGGSFHIFADNPAGGFGAPVSVPLGGNPQEVQVADLTFDGIEDLVVANAVMGAVQVLPGEADGSPGAPQVNVVGGSPSRLVLGDLDGDGFVDALASSGLHGDVLVLRGGDGALTRVATISGATVALGLVLGDMDEDGDLDAGVARGGTPGSLDVLINATYPSGSPFADLGQALPGVTGYPVLLADGSLVAGQPFAFDLLNVKPLGLSTAFVGLSTGYLPYKGGTLVPMPDLLVLGLVTSPVGTLELSGSWPPGASGATFYLQFWTYDAAGPKGKSASNALQAEVP